jgi:uncharacterized protein
MKCPNCKDQNLSISDRAGIEIDFCPDCRGVWLDRGELDKILERSRDHQPTTQPQKSYQAHHPTHPHQVPNPHHPSHADQYYQKPYKRKKSLLEELFD